MAELYWSGELCCILTWKVKEMGFVFPTRCYKPGVIIVVEDFCWNLLFPVGICVSFLSAGLAFLYSLVNTVV